jgi:uncharacterized protein YidB (DUF937 family)
MGFLDSVLGSVLESHPNAGAMQSVLASILGGGQPGHDSPAGLPGLIEAFGRAGMGNLISSWISSGHNQPVAPGQLQQVFGQEQINQWSQQTGMPQHSLLEQLSHLLPRAVDQATPNGQVPPPGPGPGPEGASPFDAPGLELPQR